MSPPQNSPQTSSSDMLILLGGSFDPIHNGHLATAEAVRQYLHAADATLLPAACSPLKRESTADQHRVAMLRLAIADYPHLLLDERELRRPPPSYTIDTLRELRATLGNERPIVWVMGSDTLNDLPRWKHWRELTALAHMVVVDRANSVWPKQGEVANWLGSIPRAQNSDQLQCRPCGMWLRIALPPQPYSSTDIRLQLIQHRHRHNMPKGLPVRVWQYILDNHLYLPNASPNMLPATQNAKETQ